MNKRFAASAKPMASRAKLGKRLHYFKPPPRIFRLPFAPLRMTAL